jgi:hypothetical protein
MEPTKIYMTIKQFAEEQSRKGWPTYDSIRNLRRDRKTNGFASAFITIGTRVLVDVNEFWNCVERKGNRDKE